MSAAQDRREAIADLIRPLVPDTWAVLASPPASEPVPAVVVGPDSPYMQRVTFALTEQRLRLTLVQPVVAGQFALDVIDEVLAWLLPLLDTLPGLRWQSVESVGRLETRGGKDVVVASIPISLQ